MTAPAATFSVEYGCERRCRVEVDLTGQHIRMTLNQMMARAELAHKASHERLACRTFTLRPGVPAAAEVQR